MSEYIIESEMKFGPFSEDTLLHIETSPQYIEIQDGMRITEFIHYDKEKKRIISLEAKKTAPNPKSDKVDNPEEVFSNYINDIMDKFVNSLDLYSNMALKKEVPSGFKKIDYKTIEILFILVIKNHEKTWLVAVKEALENAIKSVHRTNKIWKCKVLAINESIAIERGLIE